MSSSLLNIDVSGLRVADVNLQVTSNNIVNASTPGYSRREVAQIENIPPYADVGYLGQGTSVTAVKHIYNQFLTAQIRGGQAPINIVDQLNSLVSGLGKYISDSDSGPASSLISFFNTADGSAFKPPDTTARQVFLNAVAGL